MDYSKVHIYHLTITFKKWLLEVVLDVNDRIKKFRCLEREGV
jgi:hypothetical protein